MPYVGFLQTVRVGQLTGSKDSVWKNTWPLLVDAQGWPLLNDTGTWGVAGVDEGANTEHSDGRLYFFFGDVIPTPNGDNPRDADLVAWTDDTQVLRHGGHLPLGLNFVLPYEPTSVPGQRDWRFCGKCNGMYWDGDPNGFKGVCSKGGGHVAAGWRFVLPYEPTGVQGQRDWRFCPKCAGLFWNGDASFKGACPKGGPHAALGWTFVLPYEPAGVQGQRDWHFCGKCAGMFWDGDAHKGLCPGAPGGGLYLHPVLKPNSSQFDPFAAEWPIGQTLTFEIPNGAFSFGGRVYVFAGISRKRDGDPTYGCYLVSKDRPDLPGAFKKEFLWSPRIGWCPKDQTRDRLESHEVLGFKFVLPHDIPESPTRQANWRFCGKCEAMFWDGDPNNKGRCVRGGGHMAVGANFVLSHDLNEDARNQANWRFCGKCAALFWNGDANKGLCPGGGVHAAIGFNFVLPHDGPAEDAHNQGGWRFCTKCHGMVFTGQNDMFSGTAPVVVKNAEHPELPQSPYVWGVVVLAFSWAPVSAIRLAWMPLNPATGPMLQETRYYTGKGSSPWSDRADDAAILFPRDKDPTSDPHMSAAWLDGPKRWIILYPKANNGNKHDQYAFRRPAVARMSASLFPVENWTAEIEVFNPDSQRAYGQFMHQGGVDHFNLEIPPQQDPNQQEDGWAYGVYILNRFTEWDAARRDLGIYYLLSTSSPYQVHLMYTKLHVY